MTAGGGAVAMAAVMVVMVAGVRTAVAVVAGAVVRVLCGEEGARVYRE